MSFMADYGPEHDDEETSEWRDAVQRWTVVVVFLTAILLVRSLL